MSKELYMAVMEVSKLAESCGLDIVGEITLNGTGEATWYVHTSQKDAFENVLLEASKEYPELKETRLELFPDSEL